MSPSRFERTPEFRYSPNRGFTAASRSAVACCERLLSGSSVRAFKHRVRRALPNYVPAVPHLRRVDHPIQLRTVVAPIQGALAPSAFLLLSRNFDTSHFLISNLCLTLPTEYQSHIQGMISASFRTRGITVAFPCHLCSGKQFPLVRWRRHID